MKADEAFAIGLAIERNGFAGLFATEDREIGMRNFVEGGPGRPGSADRERPGVGLRGRGAAPGRG
ncbi:hypothetical protein TN53_12315 [Streptomyces sp. WM6386]|nr:hypothetical protein TN53_12315 [Streptomyces sp. WM6386]